MQVLPVNFVSEGRRSSHRRGFTLVEMLVSITIFVILATLTLGAFKGVSKNDHITAATNQIKGWFERAKSKAIHDKLPRGVRFLPDASNPGLCSSVVYIGSAGYDEGNLSDPTATTTPTQKCVRVVSGVGGLLVMPYVDSTNGQQSATFQEWRALRGTGALTTSTALSHGLRIEIPRDSGFWYPIAGVSTTGGVVLTLGRSINNHQAFENEKVDYRLELGPTVLEEDPSALPRGIVIDLDGSILPSEWRTTWLPSASPPQWALTSNLDVMFSPQGVFTGQVAPRIGVLHLLVSTLEDADAARANAAGNHPQDLTTAPPRTAAYKYPFVLANPKTTQKVVSIFTGSGRVTTSDVFVYTYSSGGPVLFDPYANSTFNDIRLDTSLAPLLPFKNALVGKEVK